MVPPTIKRFKDISDTILTSTIKHRLQRIDSEVKALDTSEDEGANHANPFKSPQNKVILTHIQ